MKKVLKRSLLLLVCALLMGNAGCLLLPLKHSDYRPIHHAARACDAQEAAQILATNSAALNIADDAGRTPLQVASARCCTNVIGLLLQRGAKLEAKGKSGETALHIAAQEGCLDAIAMLANKGANINARDKNGHTPLRRALDYQQGKAVELLRMFGAKE